MSKNVGARDLGRDRIYCQDGPCKGGRKKLMRAEGWEMLEEFGER